jgi:hypothetical protein
MADKNKGSDAGRPVTKTRFPGGGMELTQHGQRRVVTAMTNHWVRTIEHGRQSYRVIG